MIEFIEALIYTFLLVSTLGITFFAIIIGKPPKVPPKNEMIFPGLS